VQELNTDKSFSSTSTNIPTPDMQKNILNQMFDAASDMGFPLLDLLEAAVSVQNNELDIQNSASGILSIMSQDASVAISNGASLLNQAAEAVQAAAGKDANSNNSNDVTVASDYYNTVSTLTQQSNSDDSNVINGQSTQLSNLSQTEAQATIPTSAVTDAMSNLTSLLASTA